MDQGLLRRDERRAWLALTLIGGATLAALGVGGFTINWGGIAVTIGSTTGLSLIARFYRTVRPDPRLATPCAALAQLVLMTAIGGPLSYLVACLDWPLYDAQLQQADLLLGFHWRAALASVDTRPIVGLLLKLGYDSLMPQLAVTLVVLGFGGKLTQLRILTWAVCLSAFVTVAISALVPAVGYYVSLGLSPIDYPHLHPSADFVHLADFKALRDGGLRAIDPAEIKGIITFPSLHAALAVLFAWGLWQHRVTRWAGFGFELVVLCSTPIDGGHYLVDVIAGGLLAAASLVVAHRIVQAPRPRGSYSPSRALAPPVRSAPRAWPSRR